MIKVSTEDFNHQALEGLSRCVWGGSTLRKGRKNQFLEQKSCLRKGPQNYAKTTLKLSIMCDVHLQTNASFIAIKCICNTSS